MPTRNKVISLTEAVSRFVPDGAHITIGGFTLNRNPMAAVYEIIRQKDHRPAPLRALQRPGGRRTGRGRLCRPARDRLCRQRAVRPDLHPFPQGGQESGQLAVEDYSNYQMTLRFMAGAMGVPFLPTRSSLGSDIVDQLGVFRSGAPGGPARSRSQSWWLWTTPSDGWGDTDRVVLVPAINPDVTMIHVQHADRQGTARIAGLTFADVEQAKAARHVIVTCEELVERPPAGDTRLNQLPFLLRGRGGAGPLRRLSHRLLPPLRL